MLGLIPPIGPHKCVLVACLLTWLCFAVLCFASLLSFQPRSSIAARLLLQGPHGSNLGRRTLLDHSAASHILLRIYCHVVKQAQLLSGEKSRRLSSPII